MGCNNSNQQSSSVQSPEKQSSSSTQKKQNPSQQQIEQKPTKENITISNKDLIGQKTQKFLEVYNFTELLGKGSFGEVRKAIHKQTGSVFAVKILKKNMMKPEDEKAILQEIDIMKNVDHPNIIKIIEYYSEPTFLYIVMEYCNGGELFDRKIIINDENIALIARKILSPINYAHTKKITHRDLKPQNILYQKQESDSDLKVVDWGLSTFFKDDEKFDKIMGTPLFMSPEIISKQFDEKSDIWAIGMILLMQITEVHPFLPGCQTIRDLLLKVKEGYINYDKYPQLEKVSEECRNFIKWLLTVDKNKRPSAQEALDCAWMKQYSDSEKLQFSDAAQASLQQLTTFQTQNKLQQATWMFFSQFFATEQQTEELKKAFVALDKNNDGLLSHEELRNGVHLFLSADKPEEEINKLINEIDSNQNGKIDYHEFVQAAINREQLICKENIKKAFEMLDTDQSGKITVAEYKGLFCGGVVPEDVWKEMFKDVDENGDQEISLQEFQKIIENIGAKIKNE